MFGRAGFNSFRRAPGFMKGQQQFKNFNRMQAGMNYAQFSTLNKAIMLSQASQLRLSATSVLLMQIRVNALTLNEEAECGLNPLSEDLGKWIGDPIFQI